MIPRMKGTDAAARTAARAGYTLLELLVVLGVLSMLTSLVLSATQTARERARITVCVSNTRQLLQGVKLYETDYGGAPIHTGAGEGHWERKLDPYVRSRAVYLCPSDVTGGTIYAMHGWPSSYAYLFNDLWLGVHGEYRAPAAWSPLVVESSHRLTFQLNVVGRYDGSVEQAPLGRYQGFHMEMEDGQGIVRW